MRRWSCVVLAGLLVATGATACGDDDDDDATDAAQPDAAESDASAQQPDATPAADAPAPDATVPDTIFAFLDDSLFRVDPTTAALTEIGATGLGAMQFAGAAWDPDAGVARIIATAYATPTLATVDLCTGAVTTGPRLAIGGTDLGQAEGFTISLSTGTLYASVDADGGGAFLSEALGSIDPSTGAVTVIGGPVDTLQDDIDQLSWVAGDLIGLDVLSGTGAQLYDIDPATGVATVRTDVSGVVNRLVYDPARGRFLAATAREATRRLVEVDPATGALTTVGTTHTDAEYGGNTIDALVIAPAPSCP